MKKRLYVIMTLVIMAASVSACNTTVNIQTDPTEETAVSDASAVSEDTVSNPGETAVPEEESDDAPSIDISGCDTFTQIVDKKLTDGMGYANETIGDQDVLLVCSGAYDDLEGHMAAIDAALFIYGDEGPVEIGSVSSAGTAYPLCIKDGQLYAAAHHWIARYTIEGNKLVVAEEAVENFDSDGNSVYEGRFEELFGEMQEAQIINFSVVSEVSDLPPYEYPGPEAFYSVLYKYMTDELSEGYSDFQVTIPCPMIIAMDESNNEDIRVWGNFWVFNYNKTDDILECVSGGSYPGCIHLKAVDTPEGYEVTQMEQVGDGSDYDPTAKKIFGKYYEDLIRSDADTEAFEATRAQIIANYVAANDLDITAYKDYGWDKVVLPEENIDSFYSQLD